uniref:Uncharacterized protein n=1 Tax=Bigelowiella natans TaxID=227086 RepID=A0A6T9YIT0_BIGNA|mmetsp:Transcript_1174/g.1805  ORF Transcript_1174/g.1805 Transcript_1174/m.1805 type:complete len:256 (+) Transcript_1174:35-802(+)
MGFPPSPAARNFLALLISSSLALCVASSRSAVRIQFEESFPLDEIRNAKSTQMKFERDLVHQLSSVLEISEDAVNVQSVSWRDSAVRLTFSESEIGRTTEEIARELDNHRLDPNSDLWLKSVTSYLDERVPITSVSIVTQSSAIWEDESTFLMENMLPTSAIWDLANIKLGYTKRTLLLAASIVLLGIFYVLCLPKTRFIQVQGTGRSIKISSGDDHGPGQGSPYKDIINFYTVRNRKRYSKDKPPTPRRLDSSL